MMAKDLPPRENALFKRILKCYENKQYKSGLKHARQILSNSKFQEHGETLAMMGLTLNCLGRKPEAYDNVKRGLRNNLTSHVCWHVFGLLQRSDKKYEEAIKCYRNALRWDKDNLQILRDLSLLQIQTRDLEGYKMTRHQLLMLRANQRAGWVGYAIALHMLGDSENALNVLQTFRKTQEGKEADYEFSELLLYEASIMVEADRYRDALTHIYTHRDSIVDLQSWLEMAGDLHGRLGEHEDSAAVFEQLFHRNPENVEYIDNFITSSQPGDCEESLQMGLKLQAEYPKAEAPTGYILKLSTGSTFRSLVDGYLQRQLRKGVTPLFNILKHLFNDQDKLETIKDLLHGYLKYLEEFRKFTPENKDEELPTSYLHVLIFIAQLYDYERDTKEALNFIERAIQHTPTYIDPYVVKSKIYKHAGDLGEAVHWMDEARTLDLADRYLNSKCAKYMLRAGQIAKAEETCSFFTREGQAALENLNEMQCMWFLTECARTHHVNRDIPACLQKCHEVEKHFVDIVEDQFDFHPYSMRKMTLRAYIGLLRLEDSIRAIPGHKFFNKTADLAIRTYLHLHDKPLASTNGLTNGDNDELTAKEKKKLESKKKRAAKKKQQQTVVTTNATQKDKKTAGPDGELINPVISGEDLVKTETPLEDAMIFLGPLRALSPMCPNTNRLAFEVFYRQGKLLLMLQSLMRAIKACPSSAEIPLHMTQIHTFAASADVSNPVLREIMDYELELLVPGGDIAGWLSEKEAACGKDFSTFFFLRCSDAHLNPDSSRSQLDKFLQFDLSSAQLPACERVWDCLQAGLLSPSPEDLEMFKSSCNARFPLANTFLPPQPEEETIPR